MTAALVVGAGLLLAAGSGRAHHSFAAEYDSNNPITLTGQVTKVEWMNPHARFYVDVTDEYGGVTNWEFELGSPNGLTRAGWKRDTLKPGDRVTVEGFLARDGSKMANAYKVLLGDGRQVFGASSKDSGQ